MTLDFMISYIWYFYTQKTDDLRHVGYIRKSESGRARTKQKKERVITVERTLVKQKSLIFLGEQLVFQTKVNESIKTKLASIQLELPKKTYKSKMRVFDYR